MKFHDWNEMKNCPRRSTAVPFWKGDSLPPLWEDLTLSHRGRETLFPEDGEKFIGVSVYNGKSTRVYAVV